MGVWPPMPAVTARNGEGSRNSGWGLDGVRFALEVRPNFGAGTLDLTHGRNLVLVSAIDTR